MRKIENSVLETPMMWQSFALPNGTTSTPNMKTPTPMQPAANEELIAPRSAAACSAGWLPIDSAPTDGTEIIVYCPPAHGLNHMASVCTYHEEAGFCVDELREPTLWIPLPNRKKRWHRCQRENAMKTEPTPTLAAVVQPRLVRRCVSHHFACDCREAAFAELLKDVMQLHCDPNGAQYNKCDTAPCSWCEEAKRLMLHGHPDTTNAKDVERRESAPNQSPT
jgi:hypothetical protein